MRQRYALALAAGAALAGSAATAKAQGQAPPPPPMPAPSVLFDGGTFDVTGAGLLDLGDIDEVLGPFRRDFGDGLDGLPLELTVDAAGAVISCSAQGAPRLEPAGQALCAHAVANGRFTKTPMLVLDYTLATYRLKVRRSSDRARGGSRAFYTNAGFPYQGIAVRFGWFDLPPEAERLTVNDVQLAGMEYPTAVLREGLGGRVEVLLTFNEAGRVATCRPIASSNSARLAYETCYEVWRVARLNIAPDSRPLAFATRWMLAD